jgi:hypothetical protein
LLLHELHARTIFVGEEPPQKTQRLALLLHELHARTIFEGEEPPQKTQRLAWLLQELHARTISAIECAPRVYQVTPTSGGPTSDHNRARPSWGAATLCGRAAHSPPTGSPGTARTSPGIARPARDENVAKRLSWITAYAAPTCLAPSSEGSTPDVAAMARGIGRRTHRIPPQKTQRLALLLQKLHARTIFVGEEPPQKTQRLALLLQKLHARTISAIGSAPIACHAPPQRGKRVFGHSGATPAPG